MTRQFTGWPRQAYDVLLQLDGLPSNETRERLRKDRERLVRRPMIDLLNDLADDNPRYADFSVWGYGKDPFWWQHQGGIIRIARCVEYVVRFDLDGLHVKGAWHYPDPGQVPRYRAAVDNSGRDLAELVDSLRGKGYDITGDVMKRMPREYPADHPYADLLRHRTLIASQTMSNEDWLWTPQALTWVADRVEELDELMDWLAGAVASES